MISGCNTLSNLDKFAQLKRYSNNQDQTDAYVEAVDHQYLRLKKAVTSEGSLSEFDSKEKILSAFGEPILIERKFYQGQEAERWLYRRAVDFWSGDKIYIYFNKSGSTLEWMLLGPATADS